MLARYFLQRLCEDTNNSEEFEYPTRESRGRDDDLIDCCYCEIRGSKSGLVGSQVCWDVSFVDWYVGEDVSKDRAFETSITFPVDTTV